MFRSVMMRLLFPLLGHLLGLKPRSLREPRPYSKQQLGQKRDHRPLPYHTPIRASSPDKGFGRHTTLSNRKNPSAVR